VSLTTSKRRATALLPSGGHSLSPEARLVLCTAGGPETDAAIDLLVPRITNWPRLLELSVIEGAQPVLGRRLRESSAQIPDDVAPALEYIERAASFRQRYLESRMIDALRLMSAASIPVVLLKGAALVNTTYASFQDRPMSDVDLLVRPEQAERANALLCEAGWARHYDRGFDGFYETMHHLPPLIDARAPSLTVGLEVHTAIIQRDRDPFAFSSEQMWDAARVADGLPSGTLVPSVVHRLFHCCLHFAWSHKLSKGAWRTFRDVSAMIRAESIDWSDFVATAQAARGVASCYWTLRLARALANAPIPDDVLGRLRPDHSDLVLHALERHFSHTVTEAEQVCPSARLQAAIWTAAFRPEPDRDGNELPWRGAERPWRLMRGPGGGAGEARIAQPRPAMSPAAWLRYAGSIIGMGAGVALWP
jgi:hypothetical protein